MKAIINKSMPSLKLIYNEDELVGIIHITRISILINVNIGKLNFTVDSSNLMGLRIDINPKTSNRLHILLPITFPIIKS